MAQGNVVFFASHAHGGVREVWTNLAEAFHQLGYDASLVGLYPLDASVEPPTHILAWSYIIPNHPNGLTGKFKMIFGLAKWMRANQPEYILSSMPAANVLVASFARVFSPATKVIVSHHSPSTVYRRALNFLDRISGSGKNVTAIVSVSESVNATLQNKPAAYRAKRHTIHNAVPPHIERLISQLVASANGRDPGRKIVASGRLEAVKNHPMLLRAVAQVPGVTVDILGCGGDEDKLRELTRALKIQDRIAFLGNRDREEALALMARADVFVQVSLFEGHSLALIEAAKLGLPLIVSNVPSQVEAVTLKDGTLCGQIVELGDDAGLARAIKAVVDDPAAHKMWRDLSLRLGEECTFESMVSLYQQLLTGAHGKNAVRDISELQITG